MEGIDRQLKGLERGPIGFSTFTILHPTLRYSYETRVIPLTSARNGNAQLWPINVRARDCTIGQPVRTQHWILAIPLVGSYSHSNPGYSAVQGSCWHS